MKLCSLKPMMILCGAWWVFASTPASAVLSVLEFTGAGTVQTNGMVTLTQGCTITAAGTAAGTDLSDARFILRIDTGSPSAFNGNPVSAPQGVCLPGSFTGRITAANGDTLEFNHAGMVCEEGGPGSAYHYNGTYRLTGGTGGFAAATGAGTLTAAFTRESAEQPATVLLYLRGTRANP